MLFTIAVKNKGVLLATFSQNNHNARKNKAKLIGHIRHKYAPRWCVMCGLWPYILSKICVPMLLWTPKWLNTCKHIRDHTWFMPDTLWTHYRLTNWELRQNGGHLKANFNFNFLSENVTFWLKFHSNILPSVLQKVAIVSDTGLMPSGQQAIIWTSRKNQDYVCECKNKTLIEAWGSGK